MSDAIKGNADFWFRRYNEAIAEREEIYEDFHALVIEHGHHRAAVEAVRELIAGRLVAGDVAIRAALDEHLGDRHE